MRIQYKDIKVIDSHQFPKEIKKKWHKYVNRMFSLSNDIYVCFNNEKYGEDNEHDEIFEFLQSNNVRDETIIISRWW